LEFALTGLEDGEVKREPDINKLTVTMDEIKYELKESDNEFAVYDVTGKIIHKTARLSKGTHIYKNKGLKSGTYFIRIRDGEREINRKMVIIR